MSRTRALAFAAALPIVLAGLTAGAQSLQTPPAVSAPLAPAPIQMPPLTPAQAAVALKALQSADLHGLQPKDYLPTDPGNAEALTKGLLDYARDVRVGRLALGEFPELWALRPAPYDPKADLAKALADDRLQAFLDSLPPRYAGYHAMRRGLARYRDIAAKGGWRPVPAGPSMGLGSADPRVAALRARLAAEDPQVAVAGPATFDQPLQLAVQRAQLRYGVKPDGVAGPGTLRYLNEPVGQRILQIIANMDRWRWLPPTMPATRVQVNSGAAIVTLFRDDKPVLSMKAVSGKPGDETPMMTSAIHSVVINPPWNVPSSIAEQELWPKERAEPGYLARNGYRVITVEGGSPRLQQASGDDSALGRFKFDFDNAFAVYLHDTPAKAGFDAYARQASHGCVRVEKPRELAEALLAKDPLWTPEKIDEALGDGSKTLRVRLTEQVPVFIMYWTSFAGSDGQMHFRSDSYGWDRQLLQLTGVLAPPAKQA